MGRGKQRTTSRPKQNRKLVYAGLTDEELKTAVLMEHPGCGRRWIKPEQAPRSEAFGYKYVEPTVNDARPHDKLAMSVEVPKPAALNDKAPTDKSEPRPKKGKGNK